MGETVLIADDDPDILLGLKNRLIWLGYDVLTAQNGEEALRIIDEATPSLLLLDLEMPHVSGLDVLRKLADNRSALPVIVLTAFGSIQRAVEALKLGAYDFLTKPFDPDHLGVVLRKALEREALRREVRYLRGEVDSRYTAMVTESPAMKAIVTDAKRAAETDAIVLLQGETGTGKEVLARAIHRWSPRASAPFMAINCAALPEQLLENELFGHEKGAFTGATHLQAGKLEAANGGTVFLDEIGDMPLAMQTRLLRLLEDCAFHRVGGTHLIRANVRFIAATNRDLKQCVRAGTFREDLFFRLYVVPVLLPPLRERREDILPLAAYYVHRGKRQGGASKRLTEEAKVALHRYAWPGNIRELENVVARALVLSPADEIDVKDLKLDVPPMESEQSSVGEVTGSTSYHEAMETYSRRLIVDALKRSGWNQTKAAALLQLQRTYFTKMLKRKALPTKPPYHDSL
jgi:DNA-binding NtrC family response regulator